MELLSPHSQHSEMHAMTKEIERNTLDKSLALRFLEIAREAKFIGSFRLSFLTLANDIVTLGSWNKR